MRLRKYSCMKVIIVSSTVILFMINISQYGDSAWGEEESADNANKQSSNTNKNLSAKPNLTRINQTAAAGSKDKDTVLSDSLAGSRDSLAGSRIHGLPNSTSNGEENREERNSSSSATILARIHHANKEQVIINSDLFGEVTNNTIVIVIQVHDRLEYLRCQADFIRIN